VEGTNLSECHLPLFDALKELAESGAIIRARALQCGRLRCCITTSICGAARRPINASNHGIWQTGGAWLSTHLWEHYLCHRRREFLRTTAYPFG